MTRVSRFIQEQLDSFVRQSRLIRRTGSGAMLRPPARSETIYARACTFAEILMRVWKPLIADELLLEAHK